MRSGIAFSAHQQQLRQRIARSAGQRHRWTTSGGSASGVVASWRKMRSGVSGVIGARHPAGSRRISWRSAGGGD